MFTQNHLKERVYQIDLFRFIAALSVVLYHYLFRGYAADNRTTLNLVEAGAYFKYGYLGVHWFFIISGFVIALSIRNQSLRDFLTARFIRLYPAYWFGVALTFLIILFFGAPQFTATVEQAVVNLSMFQSFFGVRDIDGAYWSLAVELKFYFFIAGFLIVKKFLRKMELEPVVICWLVLTIIYAFNRELTFIRAANHLLFFDYSALFIAGIVFFQIFENGVTVKRLSLVVVCLITSFFIEVENSRILVNHYHAEFSPYVLCLLLALFFVSMFLVSVRKLSAMNLPKLVYIGALTYPLYLIHQNIGYILFNNFGGHFNRYALFGIVTVSIICVAYLINRKIEVPVARFLRNRLSVLRRKSFVKTG